MNSITGNFGVSYVYITTPFFLSESDDIDIVEKAFKKMLKKVKSDNALEWNCYVDGIEFKSYIGEIDKNNMSIEVDSENRVISLNVPYISDSIFFFISITSKGNFKLEHFDIFDSFSFYTDSEVQSWVKLH